MSTPPNPPDPNRNNNGNNDDNTTTTTAAPTAAPVDTDHAARLQIAIAAIKAEYDRLMEAKEEGKAQALREEAERLKEEKRQMLEGRLWAELMQSMWALDEEFAGLGVLRGVVAEVERAREAVERAERERGNGEGER